VLSSAAALLDELFEQPAKLWSGWSRFFRGACHTNQLTDGWPLQVELARQYTRLGFRGELPMVLIYESDPLDNEDARGRFYHVCRGRIDRNEIHLPAGEQVYECAVCGIDLEAEDFWMARQKGSV